MKILASNDDGIYAPGLKALTAELKNIASLRVVAPDRNRSASSSALTINRPLSVEELGDNYFSVNGTPTDCVHLGLTGLFDDMPDMVVSGINSAENLGDDVWYSGTVAAAIEGRYLGLPAIAVSMSSLGPVKHYETGALVVKNVVQVLVGLNLPSKTILNINVPDLPLNELKGVQITRLGARHHSEPVIREISPRGAAIYWIGKVGVGADVGEGTDFGAIKEHCVSVTPLQLDMTNYKLFDKLSIMLDKMNF